MIPGDAVNTIPVRSVRASLRATPQQSLLCPYDYIKQNTDTVRVLLFWPVRAAAELSFRGQLASWVELRRQILFERGWV